MASAVLGVSLSRIALLAAVGVAALLLTPAAERALCVWAPARVASPPSRPRWTRRATVTRSGCGPDVRRRSRDRRREHQPGRRRSDRTVIRGGGPVLTIGTFGAPAQPTVAVRRVRITGGVTRSSPESVPFVGAEGIIATGGGIEIPPNQDFTGGATVTVTDSVIRATGWRPLRRRPSARSARRRPLPVRVRRRRRHPQLGDAQGGGLRRARQPGRHRIEAVDAGQRRGWGGILSQAGSLSLVRSAVSDNEATATGPEGRFAEGGGSSPTATRFPCARAR